MTANHVEHEIATFPGSSGARPGPAIAYSTVGTGRTPSAVPSSSNFPASHSDSEPGLIAQSYRTFSSSPLGRPTRVAPEAQAIFRRRRYKPRRPPLAEMRPGSPAPTMGPVSRKCRVELRRGAAAGPPTQTRLRTIAVLRVDGVDRK